MRKKHYTKTPYDNKLISAQQTETARLSGLIWTAPKKLLFYKFNIWQTILSKFCRADFFATNACAFTTRHAFKIFGFAFCKYLKDVVILATIVNSTIISQCHDKGQKYIPFILSNVL